MIKQGVPVQLVPALHPFQLHACSIVEGNAVESAPSKKDGVWLAAPEDTVSDQ